MLKIVIKNILVIKIFSQGCMNNCSNNGICDPFLKQCYCDKEYVGFDCSVLKNEAIQCPNNCSESGECDFQIGKCYCRPGFLGDDCSILESLCPNQCCGNLGQCKDTGCECKHPLTGHDCFNYICKNNCHGNGQCQKDGSCKCNIGFYGDFCELLEI